MFRSAWFGVTLDSSSIYGYLPYPKLSVIHLDNVSHITAVTLSLTLFISYFYGDNVITSLTLLLTVILGYRLSAIGYYTLFSATLLSTTLSSTLLSATLSLSYIFCSLYDFLSITLRHLKLVLVLSRPKLGGSLPNPETLCYDTSTLRSGWFLHTE